MPLELPVVNAAKQGRELEFKVNTESIAGWWTACHAEWCADLTPQQMHARISEGGAGEANKFELHLEVGPDGLVVKRAVIGGNFWGHNFPKPDFTDVAVPAQFCSNTSVKDDGEVEYGDGDRNNGLALIIEHPLLKLRIWPKREDRLRLDVRQPGGQIRYLELDTHE